MLLNLKCVKILEWYRYSCSTILDKEKKKNIILQNLVLPYQNAFLLITFYTNFVVWNASKCQL